VPALWGRELRRESLFDGAEYSMKLIASFLAEKIASLASRRKRFS
jgi:hypothetical protein